MSAADGTSLCMLVFTDSRSIRRAHPGSRHLMGLLRGGFRAWSRTALCRIVWFWRRFRDADTAWGGVPSAEPDRTS